MSIKIDEIKSEERFKTKDLYTCLGMYTAESIRRKWLEEFVDKQTGELVKIERSEVILNKGDYIGADEISRLNFHLTAGDIDFVSVSTVKRMGELIEDNYIQLFIAVLSIRDKKKKVLLYSNSVNKCIEILKFWGELEFSSGFKIVSIKEFENTIVLTDTLLKPEQDAEEAEYAKVFYNIDLSYTRDELPQRSEFIVHAANVDKALLLCELFLAKTTEPGDDLGIVLNEAKLLQFDYYIDEEITKYLFKSNE